MVFGDLFMCRFKRLSKSEQSNVTESDASVTNLIFLWVKNLLICDF